MIIEDLKTWRMQFPENRKLVVTNGCFDILHAGHVDYLERSKAFGDYLLVGINNDESVKTLKGYGRPINNQFYRSYVLDNLKFVDFVYIFDGVRCVDFLNQSKPHVYTKGGDYSIDSLHKGEVNALMTHQTQINIIKLKYNISTTSILSKI